MFEEEPPDSGCAENLWCLWCGSRFYSAAATSYVDAPCPGEGCDGRLSVAVPKRGPRIVRRTESESDGSIVA